MKKLFYLASLAAAAIAVSSCQKEVVDNTTPVEGKMVEMSITAGSSTKTQLNGDDVTWSSGDKLTVIQTVTGGESEGTTTTFSQDGVTTDDGQTMTFNFSFTEITDASSFVYNAVYPAEAVQTANKPASVTINTKSNQVPAANSFDPSADLLIAKPSEPLATQPTESVAMRFQRMIALGQMTVKNLGSEEDITKVTFSAVKGGENVILAGRTAYNLTEGKIVSTYGSSIGEKTISLDYIGKNVKANTSMVAYFTCYPFALAENDKFTVTVETATKVFTKEVTLGEGKSLGFSAGNGAKFTVNMSGIVGVTKAIDFDYACLTAADYAAVSTSSSYASVKVTKEYGDVWDCHTCYVSSAIGVRRNDNGSNDSYITLPDFERDYAKVIVKVAEGPDNKTFTLESSKNSTDGSIASLTTSTSQTVYEFDLSEKTVKTAFFRSSGAQAKVLSIEVIAKNDTREPVAGTSTVSAILNSEANNAIDVTWNKVSDGIGYIVTCTPDEGDEVSVIINDPEQVNCTITDLEYSTAYTVAVTTLADKYFNTDSDPVACDAAVETGAAPAGEFTDVLDRDFTGIASGSSSYSSWSNKASKTSDAVYAGCSAGGNNSIQLRTSGNKEGIISTTSAGYVNTVSIDWNSNTRTDAALGVYVYGSNTAFSSASDLHDSSKKGTLLGTILRDANAPLEVEGGYKYIGIRSISGAIYLNKITIKWTTVAPAEKCKAPVISCVNNTVTINCDTENATIHYTTDGSNPTTSSAIYSTPFSISQNTTVKAIAVKDGIDNSSVTSKDCEYVKPTCEDPVITLDGDVATITCPTEGATIRYEVGTSPADPTETSAEYTSGVALTNGQTIKAKAFKDGWNPSVVVSKTYSAGGQEYTATWTATSGGLGTAVSYDFKDDKKNTWNVTRSSVESTGWSSNCIQLGKNGGVETVTFTGKIPGIISEVSVECASYKGNHNISIKVGETTFLSATATSSWTTVETKKGTGSASGDVVIKFDPQSSARAMYIKSITVKYKN